MRLDREHIATFASALVWPLCLVFPLFLGPPDPEYDAWIRGLPFALVIGFIIAIVAIPVFVRTVLKAGASSFLNFIAYSAIIVGGLAGVAELPMLLVALSFGFTEFFGVLGYLLLVVYFAVFSVPAAVLYWVIALSQGVPANA